MAIDVSVLPFSIKYFTKKLEFSSVKKQKLDAIVSTPLNSRSYSTAWLAIHGSSRFSREKQDLA